MRKNKLIDAVTGLILECCHPVQVRLFGSQAADRLHAGSDLDLLVVCRPGDRNREIEKELRETLRQFAVDVDVHCVTLEELAVAERQPYTILHTMLSSGIQLYP